MTKNINKQNSSGQVIVISVITLGLVMIGITAITGILLRNQLRQSRDAGGSIQAIFAADAGVELVSMCYFKGNCDPNNPPSVSFEGTSVGFTATSTLEPDLLTILSKGTAYGTIRIIETAFLNP